MDELDRVLKQLRDAPVHPGLANFDGAMLARAAQEKGDDARRPVVVAALMALVMGVAGSALPLAAAGAAPLMPFGAPTMLAPSTLLND